MKNKKKRRVIWNMFFNVIALISFALALVFCIYLYKLDMVPENYLKIAFMVLGGVYLLLFLFTFPRHLKFGLKIFPCFLFIVFALVFGYGIKYADKTISFVDMINDELKQKEEYQIKTITNGDTKEKLSNKKIGVFRNANYDKILKILNREIECKVIEYTDPVELFEDVQNKKIDAVIASDNVFELLQTDLSYMKLDLYTAHTLNVPVDANTTEIVKVVDVTNTPFNIFVAGGDAYGSIDKVMNTDVNMIVSVDPVNHKLLLTSIPRDYYVLLPGRGENIYDKLTHAGYYGVGESVLAVEKLLDIDINYYAKVNFSTIEKIVDSIGGIDIYNFKKFTSSDEITHFPKGNIHLNGHEALMYARERQSFADGDVQRVKNQQTILSAIINKITSSTTIISKYTSLLDAISSSFSTNLDTKSINRLVKAQINDMRGWNLESQNLVGYSATSRECFSIPKMSLYVMKQNPESVKAASDKIKEFINK